MQQIKLHPNPPDASKPYCLENADGSIAGWFATHEEAVSAMNRTSKSSRMYSEESVEHFLAPVVQFEFSGTDNAVWIEALEAKDYHTSEYGKVPVTLDKLNNLATSVRKNVRGIELSTDYVHGRDASKGQKASGTIKDAKVTGNKLMLNVAFTDNAKKEIQDGEWKYFSSDWLDNYTHDDGSKHTDVLVGGALTNRPVAKGLSKLPVNFSEMFTENVEFSTLTASQRNALPDSKFLYIEKDGTKHLPVPDDAHIRAAISRLSQKATGTVAGESWLTDSLRSSLLSKARAMLNKKSMGEGSDNVNELLKKLATELGIQFSEDTPEDEVSEKVFAEFTKLKADNTELTAEVEPLRKLKATTEQQKSFAEQFPEQAAQMEADRKFREETTSKSFAETVGTKRFSENTGAQDAEGKPVFKKTTRGLSALALDTIRDTRLKFSENTVTVEDFAKTIDTILDGGIVDYGETGTSLSEPETGDVPVNGDTFARRNAFAERVLEVQKENSKGDTSMSFAEALPIAAAKYPKQYDDYMGARA